MVEKLETQWCDGCGAWTRQECLYEATTAMTPAAQRCTKCDATKDPKTGVTKPAGAKP